MAREISNKWQRQDHGRGDQACTCTSTSTGWRESLTRSDLSLLTLGLIGEKPSGQDSRYQYLENHKNIYRLSAKGVTLSLFLFTWGHLRRRLEKNVGENRTRMRKGGISRGGWTEGDAKKSVGQPCDQGSRIFWKASTKRNHKQPRSSNTSKHPR